MNKGFVVVGLGFGDEGKGTIVDWLTRQFEYGSVTVVRHNGGSQAAHNVVVPASDSERFVHHTFSQFGSGSFAGGHTHLSRFMLVNPMALINEFNALRPAAMKIVKAQINLTIDPRARVVTPLHRSSNRLQELARGADRHGSCGQGIGETVRLSLEHPDEVLRVGDLNDRALTIERLELMRKRLLEDLRELPIADNEAEWEFLRMDRATVEYFAERYENFASRCRIETDAEVLKAADNVIFEGAQGILLDEDHGFAPHTTWSKTTSANAHELMDEIGFRGTCRTMGVTRSYMTRHGTGPFPSESPVLQLPEPHNETGVWQGQWRQGWLDLDLLKYAISCDPRIEEVAVTHLDTHTREGREDWFIQINGGLVNVGYNRKPSNNVSQSFAMLVAAQLGVPVTLGSWGPLHTGKHELDLR